MLVSEEEAVLFVNEVTERGVVTTKYIADIFCAGSSRHPVQGPFPIIKNV